jgi:hypothetical protein
VTIFEKLPISLTPFSPSLQLHSVLVFLAVSLSFFAQDPLYAVERLPAFHVGRGVSLYYPFMDLIRAGKDDSPSPPYYGSWSTIHVQQVPDELKRAGFETVRVPVSPIPLLVVEDEQDRQAIYSQFAIAIDDLLRAGLNVVFDLHVTDAGTPWDHKSITSDIEGPRFQKYIEVVASIARFLSRYDASRVALEPFNEPPPPCIWWPRRPNWSVYQKKLFQAARTAAPDLTIILTGACWGSLEGLQTLRPLDYDHNTVFTFHFYEPLVFTHQGAWFSSLYVRYLSRLPYPPSVDRTDEFSAMVRARATADSTLSHAARAQIFSEAQKYIKLYFNEPQNRDFIRRRAMIAAEWAKRNLVSPQRIWVGEFGALGDVYGREAAAPEDRRRWLSDARSVFEEFGFGWAVWNYCCAMGITKGENNKLLDQDIIRALGLKPSSN